MADIVEQLREKYKDKKVLVVGLGLQRGGLGVAEFFAKLGAKVRITDKKNQEILQPSLAKLKGLPIEYTLGQHKLEDFLEADVIFKGPSVSWDLPEIKQAEAKGIPIEMESSFFAQHCPAKIIGITGARGKSTTTFMIYELLKQFNINCHLGGNIPNISTINLLSKIKTEDWVVLELSSWQLAGFHRRKLSPHIAVFTSFSPDHLNLYKSMEDYLYDKKAIYLYQKENDFLVANENLKETILADSPRSKIIFSSINDFYEPPRFVKGQHNRMNAAHAYHVAEILKLDLTKASQVIADFKGLLYRQEILGEKDGIIFVNDTTSTTPTATLAALDSFSSFPIVLILGGNSKNTPTDTLINRLIEVKQIILLNGTLTDEILPALKEKYPEKISEVFDDFKKAVEKAFEEANKLQSQGKVVVLLSPAATSFSQFNNEFHRGDEFNRIVKRYL